MVNSAGRLEHLRLNRQAHGLKIRYLNNWTAYGRLMIGLPFSFYKSQLLRYPQGNLTINLNANLNVYLTINLNANLRYVYVYGNVYVYDNI